MVFTTSDLCINLSCTQPLSRPSNSQTKVDLIEVWSALEVLMDLWFHSELSSSINSTGMISQLYTRDTVRTTKLHASGSQLIRWTTLLPDTLQTPSSRTFSPYSQTCKRNCRAFSQKSALQLSSHCSWVRLIYQEHTMMPLPTSTLFSKRSKQLRRWWTTQLFRWKLKFRMLKLQHHKSSIKLRLPSMPLKIRIKLLLMPMLLLLHLRLIHTEQWWMY